MVEVGVASWECDYGGVLRGPFVVDDVAEDWKMGLCGVVLWNRWGGLEVPSDEWESLRMLAGLGDSPLYDLSVCVSVGWGLGLW